MQNTVTPMEMCVASQVIAITPARVMGPRATTACQASVGTVSQCSNLIAGCQRAVGHFSITSITAVRTLLPGLKVGA
ncbi:hypothetical protein ORS3428_03715 [Mesorhizobium sp. ORS 3428]|nr:hypothetical protein ORS3428_03715 [Mesorhizobium sp. ORS 3428]